MFGLEVHLHHSQDAGVDKAVSDHTSIAFDLDHGCGPVPEVCQHVSPA